MFVKEHNVSIPKLGDFIFFRESISARANGKRVRTVTRHHRGHQAEFDLPKGYGGIIGTATVDGSLRKQQPDDVVFDFGDLQDWMVIPCRDFKPARLGLNDLRELLRLDEPITSTRFLSLWQIPDDGRAERLTRAIRQNIQ